MQDQRRNSSIYIHKVILLAWVLEIWKCVTCFLISKCALMLYWQYTNQTENNDVDFVSCKN